MYRECIELYRIDAVLAELNINILLPVHHYALERDKGKEAHSVAVSKYTV